MSEYPTEFMDAPIAELEQHGIDHRLQNRLDSVGLVYVRDLQRFDCEALQQFVPYVGPVEVQKLIAGLRSLLEEKRTMGTLDENIDKAVAFLREYGPQKCSAVGDHLWPTAMGTSSNPQTRQAGRVLHAAKRQGLVREIDDRYRGTLWAAT